MDVDRQGRAGRAEHQPAFPEREGRRMKHLRRGAPSFNRGALPSATRGGEPMSIRKLALAVLTAICVSSVGVASTDAAVDYKAFEDSCESSQLCVGGATPMDYPFGVAVDESGGPTRGDVDVSSLGLGGPSTVSRFTADGEPAPFPLCSSNPQISGAERDQLSFGTPTVGVVGIAV